MKKILLSMLLFIIFPLSVRAVEPVVTKKPLLTPTVIQTPVVSINNNQLQGLQDQIDKIRSENYERAIKSAEQAGDKADRFINTVVGLATIFVLVLTVVSVVFGGSVFTLIRKLNAQVTRAKKGAEVIDEISRNADKLYKDLPQGVTKLQEELANLGTKRVEGKKEIQELQEKIGKIQKDADKIRSSISEIQTLRDSARYVSGATGSAVNLGDTGVGNMYNPFGSAYEGTTGIPYGGGYAGVSLSDKRCRYCGRYERDMYSVYRGDIGPIGATGPSGPGGAGVSAKSTGDTGVGGAYGGHGLFNPASDYVCPICRSEGKS